MLLLASIALANTTGGVRLLYVQASNVPEGVAVLAPRDDVGADGSRELLRLVSFDDRDLAVDILPPSLDRSPDPTCKSHGADGYLVLEALQWSSSLRYDNVALAGSAVEITDSSRGATRFADGGGWVQDNDRAVHVGATHPGVRATMSVVGDASWAIVDCEGRRLQGWTQRETVRMDAEGRSESEARGRLDLAAIEEGRGVPALARAAQKQLRRTREDRVSRTWFDAGSPELEAAARLVKESDGRDWAAATHLWEVLARSGDKRNGARATYNLALAAERRRDFGAAAKLARDADEVLRLDWIEVYAAEMEARASVASR